MTTRALSPLAALVVLVGCVNPNPKDTQAGYPNGFETEVKTAVALKTAPKGDEQPTALLTSVDAEITKRLESDHDAILEKALADYDKERLEDGTKITKENVEVVLEDPVVAAEDTAATRKLYEGKVTKFRFTLRRNMKARILPDPTRVEAVLFCIERSWAPGDTTRFPQIFRARVMDAVNETIFDAASKLNLDPVKPRSTRTQ